MGTVGGAEAGIGVGGLSSLVEGTILPDAWPAQGRKWRRWEIERRVVTGGILMGEERVIRKREGRGKNR